MNILKLIRNIFCKHDKYYEGWFVQQVRYRECAKCGVVEIQNANSPMNEKGFSKIINGENITK